MQLSGNPLPPASAIIPLVLAFLILSSVVYYCGFFTSRFFTLLFDYCPQKI